MNNQYDTGCSSNAAAEQGRARSPLRAVFGQLRAQTAAKGLAALPSERQNENRGKTRRHLNHGWGRISFGIISVSGWCRKGDLNPHALAGGRF
jgi:hypothetical protein